MDEKSGQSIGGRAASWHNEQTNYERVGRLTNKPLRPSTLESNDW